MLTSTAEIKLAAQPDRAVMMVPELGVRDARIIAWQAVYEARRKMPKSTGASAKRLQAFYGNGFFGIRWMDSYVFFQENGIRPFTMRSLKGKTIPMWIDDPTGSERIANPKAKTRTTMSGKVQVLIFRRAVNPGAPGRIAKREANKPYTTPGRVAGRIAKGNVGVSWRHPGLEPRLFINNALTITAQRFGILPIRVYLADARFKGELPTLRIN